MEDIILTKKQKLIRLLRGLGRQYRYVGFLAGRIGSSIQYTSNLISELKRDGVVKLSERILSKGEAGVSKKRYYELVKTATEELEDLEKESKVGAK